MLVFFSRDLIFLWTKNESTANQTWQIASIFAYGTGINGLMNIPYFLTLTYGWTKIAFYQNLGLLIIMIPLTIFLSIQYGAIGGALTWAIVNTVYFFITPTLIHNKILKTEKVKWYWNDNLKIIIPCVIAFMVFKILVIKFTTFNSFLRYFVIFLSVFFGFIISYTFANSINKFNLKFLRSDK